MAEDQCRKLRSLTWCSPSLNPSCAPLRASCWFTGSRSNGNMETTHGLFDWKFWWRRNLSAGVVALVFFLVIFYFFFMLADLSSYQGGRLSMSVQFLSNDSAVSKKNESQDGRSGSEDCQRAQQRYYAVQSSIHVELGTKASPWPSSETSSNIQNGVGRWMPFPTQANETKTLLQQITAVEIASPCYTNTTAETKILGLPDPVNGRPRFGTNIVHTLHLVSFDKFGSPRCAGGDYYETDLSGPSWKSRPPVVDLLNGSYTVSLQVDGSHPGVYVFTVVLLFGSWQGLRLDKFMHADKNSPPLPWALEKEIISVEIEFFDPCPSLVMEPLQGLELRQCQWEDFRQTAWSGRWTRHKYNSSCERNEQGRFQCRPPGEACEEPWCKGAIGRLESNGWVYSSHCSFRIFTEEEVWDCVNGKWWFFWGDSNFQDTARNMLNLVLGFDLELGWMNRRFDRIFVHPRNASRSIRITSMFNGHAVETKNYQGLSSLEDPMYSAKLQSYFSGSKVPDTVLLNSGLHDGVHWRTLQEYVEHGVETAAMFWGSLLGKIESHRQPNVIYRSTVAGGGNARVLDYNPQKMELFNHIIINRFRESIPNLAVVDAFDLTFPWHWDYECTDGVHYGRAPPRGREHKYFVDLMVIHIFLNAVCHLE